MRNIRLQIEWDNELILRFDSGQEERQLSPLEVWFLRELKKEVYVLSLLQLTMTRQCSRINCLRGGEANTKYFHIHTSYRRRKNFIPKILHMTRSWSNKRKLRKPSLNITRSCSAHLLVVSSASTLIPSDIPRHNQEHLDA
jgi:hypothetical protein